MGDRSSDERATPDEGAPSLVFEPDRSGFDRYLEDTIVVDWQTPAVFEKARALVAELDDEVARVTALFEFVRDEISHSIDAGADEVPCSASQVLRAGTGLCYAKSHLLAALLRARGIPAGFGYQRLRRDDESGRFVLHGFVLAWLPEHERWVALDPRGDNDEIHTGVDLESPSLAFAPRADEGEATFPVVFARPPKRVVDVLDQAESLARIIDHLPDAIDR